MRLLSLFGCNLSRLWCRNKDKSKLKISFSKLSAKPLNTETSFCDDTIPEESESPDNETVSAPLKNYDTKTLTNRFIPLGKLMIVLFV